MNDKYMELIVWNRPTSVFSLDSFRFLCTFVPHLAIFSGIWPSDFENGLVLCEKRAVTEL